MTFIINILATIGFAIISLFGHSAPVQDSSQIEYPKVIENDWQWVSASQLSTTTNTYWNNDGAISNRSGVLSADFGSFQAFCDMKSPGNCVVAKDKNSVWVDNGNATVKDADPTTLSPMTFEWSETVGTSKLGNQNRFYDDVPYLKDASHVWLLGQLDTATLIPGADPATFSIVAKKERFLCPKKTGCTYISKDANHVYDVGTIIPNADAATFTIVDGYDGPYQKDRNAVYYNLQPIAGSDPATFKPALDSMATANGFWQDANNVYWEGRIVSNDPNQFVSVGPGGQYYKDSQHVYTSPPNVTPIPGADPATFRFIGTGGPACGITGPDAEDKNHKYCGTKIIN